MVDSPEMPTYPFKEATALLAKVMDISDDVNKRATFTSRLQEMQRIGLPQGVNSGRGVPVKYTLAQLAEICLYCDLLDLNLTPKTIARYFKGNPVFLGSFWHKILVTGIIQGQGCWLTLRMDGLSYLRDSQQTAGLFPYEFDDWSVSSGIEYEYEDPNDLIVSKDRESAQRPRPRIIINLAARLLDLLEIANVRAGKLPEYID